MHMYVCINAYIRVHTRAEALAVLGRARPYREEYINNFDYI